MYDDEQHEIEQLRRCRCHVMPCADVCVCAQPQVTPKSVRIRKDPAKQGRRK